MKYYLERIKGMQNKKSTSLKVYLSVLFIIIIFCTALLSCKNSGYIKIYLATTTSTYDSGLLEVLISAYEDQSHYEIIPIAVGTGEALALGERGIVDVLLVHARKEEDEFISQGFGIRRDDVMHNDFVIIGPEDDPLEISGLNTVEAYKKISENESIFISRGDNSGTNKKEMILWEKVGIIPGGSWYIESGQGMGATIRIADEKQAYTMTDRGTFLSHSSFLSLKVLVEGDESLFNPYGIIIINPEKHEDININYRGALDFLEFMTGEQGQAIIRDFGVEEYGKPLFYPDVIK